MICRILYHTRYVVVRIDHPGIFVAWLDLLYYLLHSATHHYNVWLKVPLARLACTCGLVHTQLQAQDQMEWESGTCGVSPLS